MSSHGPRLHRDVTGRGPRLVLVHGFTQTGRSWAPLVQHLSNAHEVVTVDLPGHGASAEIRAGMGATATLLAGAADPDLDLDPEPPFERLVTGPAGGFAGGASNGSGPDPTAGHAGEPSGGPAQGPTGRSGTPGLSGGPRGPGAGAAWIGYSLGGRACLRLALDHPGAVRALVLIGASPGIADPAERAARRAADDRLATDLEREGVAAFLTRWLAQPLFTTLPPGAANREERLANTAGGLAASLRDLGTGTQEPLWDRLGELRVPVLLLTGALDRKFTGIAARMAAAIGPNARTITVPGAGHAVHLERPDAVLAELERFLAAAG